MGSSSSEPEQNNSTEQRRNDSGQHRKYRTTQRSDAQILSNELASEFHTINTVAARHGRVSGSAGQTNDNVSRPSQIRLTAARGELILPTLRNNRTERGRTGGRRIPHFRRRLITDVFPLPPRASAEEEKCYDPADNTLEFVDGDDDMDFEYIGYKSLRARMSCGHTATPMSLTRWCRVSLDQGKTTFVCGHCNVEWPYEEVRKMALLTHEETEYFEKKLSEKAAYDYMSAKKCPGCKSSVVRTDLDHLRVLCTLCTADTKKTYEFCWQCLRKWRDPHSDHCAYNDCINMPLQILSTCSEIIFKDVSVSGCPSIRACPTCGLLLEHNRKKCKNIICSRCKEEFCFVCLKLTVDCLETSSYFIQCKSGVAPRQTSIPVWERVLT